jgi:hypothetical protein
MGTEDILKEVEERVVLLLDQSSTAQKYLVDRVREEDWSSVSNTANQLSAISQELESLTCIVERLKDMYYE